MGKDINEYFLIKTQLLKQCISLSEEILSSIEDWESLNEIIFRRGKIIQKLENLELDFKKEELFSYSEAQKSQINQLVDLILSLDNDASKLIKDEQKKLIGSMKTNIKGQKIFNYKSNIATDSGSRLDYKE